jgi:FkbM family methyltransferase
VRESEFCADLLRGFAGRVYLFEPLAENRSTIADPTSANNCHNCMLLPLVISDGVGSACLFLQADHSTPSLVPTSPSSVPVEAATLDDLVSTHPWPTLVKLDVQGADEMVLRGSAKMLSAELPPYG